MGEGPPSEAVTGSESLVVTKSLVTTRTIDAPHGPAREPAAPATIGRFGVLRELGRGGMGVVYEAYDARVDRRVAIKVVALERVGEQGRARVRREARALARLSHPNVVQVFEVGEADDALFVAMEHVEGQTLRKWHADAPRRWQEVLAVYRQAATGLAAAHDKGLVHRDFKPDNAIIGADGRVRVIDFGLARELDHEPPVELELAATSMPGDMVTESGVVLGTPAYMAPEQFLGRPLDARTDQFALCVAIFEAIYGRRPFPGATRLELADAVTRGSTIAPPQAERAPPWVLSALMRGLSVEPAARFADMRALMAALEPRRWRWWVAAAVVTTAVVVSAWTVAAKPACEDSEAAWASVWAPARREAVGRALAEAPVPYAEHTRGRVLALLDAYGAGWVQEHHAACTATRELGTQSTEVMERRMACLSSARRRFGALVGVLAEPDAAVAERAVEAASELPPVAQCADEQRMVAQAPPADPELARRVEALREELDVAIAWHDAGRYASARERLAMVVEQAEPLGHLPLLAESRVWLGLAHDALGETEAAVQTHRAAFFDAGAAGSNELAARAATHLVFEEGYQRDQYEAAEAWAEHARASLERLGGGPLEPALHMAVANVDLARGRYAAAREGSQRAVDGFSAQLGPAHPRVAQALGNLANAELRLGNLDAAVALDLRVLALTEETLGASHPAVSRIASNLGGVYLAMERYDDALERYGVALAIDEAALGPRHPSVAATRSNIALVYLQQGDLERALAEQRTLLELRQEIFGDDGLEVAGTLSNMAITLSMQGQLEAATEALRRALVIVEQLLPPDHIDVARVLHNLALAEYELERYDDALEHIRRALRIRQQGLPPLHFDTSSTYIGLAAILEARGDLAAAKDSAMMALQLRERRAPPSVGALANARMEAARLTWESGGPQALAHAMARLASDEFLAAGGDWASEHAAAEEWLDLHRPSP